MTPVRRLGQVIVVAMAFAASCAEPDGETGRASLVVSMPCPDPVSMKISVYGDCVCKDPAAQLSFDGSMCVVSAESAGDDGTSGTNGGLGDSGVDGHTTTGAPTSDGETTATSSTPQSSGTSNATTVSTSGTSNATTASTSGDECPPNECIGDLLNYCINGVIYADSCVALCADNGYDYYDFCGPKDGHDVCFCGDVDPMVLVQPNVGNKGQIFSEPGEGFYPGGKVQLYFVKPDNTIYEDPIYKTAGVNGSFDHFYDSSTVSLFGKYQYYAKDLTTGKISPPVNFFINP